MATSRYAIMGMILCTLLTSTGQVLLKKGVDSFRFDIISIITNYWLIISLFLYGLGLITMILSFKYGELSILYPIMSLSFVWVMIFSNLLLREQLNAFKISAVLMIIIGITLLNKEVKK